MVQSRFGGKSSALASVARSFGMTVAVFAALLLGVVAAAYARGGEDLEVRAPAAAEPASR